jgi:hypothetical protein
MVTAAQARDVMNRWLEAGNKLDVDAVMSLYAPDPELESPVVAELMGEPSCRIRGLASLRSYFAKAFALPYVSFHLIETAWGASSLTARYVNHKGTRSICYMELDRAGKIRRHVNHFID